jgi:hypothetical protein
VADVSQAEDLGLRDPARAKDLHRLVVAPLLAGSCFAPPQGVAAGLQVCRHDRVQLLFDPYRAPPHFRYGKTAFCEVRGEVVFCGLSAGPIP